MKFQAGPEAPRLPTEGTLRAKNSATLPRPGPMTPRYSTRRQATMMRREPAQERIFSGLFERRQVRAGSRGLQLHIPASDCHQNAARTFPEAFGFAETPATDGIGFLGHSTIPEFSPPQGLGDSGKEIHQELNGSFRDSVTGGSQETPEDLCDVVCDRSIPVVGFNETVEGLVRNRFGGSRLRGGRIRTFQIRCWRGQV